MWLLSRSMSLSEFFFSNMGVYEKESLVEFNNLVVAQVGSFDMFDNQRMALQSRLALYSKIRRTPLKNVFLFIFHFP